MRVATSAMAMVGSLAGGGHRLCRPLARSQTPPPDRSVERARGEAADDLRARAHGQLAIDAGEVELDRARAEEQRRADVAVRLALGRVDRDLQLLRSELRAVPGRES